MVTERRSHDRMDAPGGGPRDGVRVSPRPTRKAWLCTGWTLVVTERRSHDWMVVPGGVRRYAYINGCNTHITTAPDAALAATTFAAAAHAPRLPSEETADRTRSLRNSHTYHNRPDAALAATTFTAAARASTPPLRKNRRPPHTVPPDKTADRDTVLRAYTRSPGSKRRPPPARVPPARAHARTY